jgi:hypothetical protein
MAMGGGMLPEPAAPKLTMESVTAILADDVGGLTAAQIGRRLNISAADLAETRQLKRLLSQMVTDGTLKSRKNTRMVGKQWGAGQRPVTNTSYSLPSE